MSELIRLIDEYRRRQGDVSERSVARGIGVSKGTINAWRNRGLNGLPDAETLRKLAGFIGADYWTVVIPAVMRDIGYGESAATPEEEAEVRRAVAEYLALEDVAPTGEPDADAG